MGRPCFVTREWAPWTPGGIGVALSDQVERCEDGAIVLWDASTRQVLKARESLRPQISVYGLGELCAESLPVHVFPSEAHWRSHRVWKALTCLLEIEDVSAVEFPDFEGLGYVAIKAARLGLDTAPPELTVRIHGTAGWNAKGNGKRLLSLSEKQRDGMERYALRHADGVVAPSAPILDAYCAEYRLAERREIDPPRIALPANLQAGQWTAPEKSTPFRIGFLGKIQPIKGVETLIQSVLGALDENDAQGIEVHLVGGDGQGGYRSSHQEELIERIPARHQHVFRFHGALSREAALGMMLSCHAAVLPSRSETYGLAARELVALGLPTALTEISGFKDLGREASGIEWFPVDGAAPLTKILNRWRADFSAGQWPPSVVSEGASPPAETRREISTESKSDGVQGAARAEPHAESRVAAAESSPTISIVIPFFEMHEYVEACLASVESDTWPDVEIILVDDGSESAEARSTLDRLRVRFGEDGRRRVLTKKRGGLGSARNFGIEAARGEFVLPLDPDDLIVPGYLGTAVRAFECAEELCYVVGISSLFQEAENPEKELDWIVPYEPTMGTLCFENGAGTAAAVFRRETLVQFPYREDLPAYEDWDLHLRLARAGHAGEALPVTTHRYRQRRDGLARLGGRHHDELLVDLLAPHFAGADPDLSEALEMYVAGLARMRGLGSGARPGGRSLALRFESFYRRHLKTRMSAVLGEERRDRIAAAVRRSLTR